jgi:hypothetical protein
LIEKTGDDAKKVGRKLTEKGKELMEGLKWKQNIPICSAIWN